MNDKYPEILSDLHAKFAEKLEEKRAKIAEKNCNLNEVAFDLCEIIRRDWSGIDVYIPKGVGYDIRQRDWEMYRLFNGHNYDALARQFNLTDRQVRTRINLVREAEMARRQPSLFAD
jgi:Mor family transcriptional regulator